MSEIENSDGGIMLTLLAAIERRDRGLLQSLYHPEIEFHWPPGLPYSGVFRAARLLKCRNASALSGSRYNQRRSAAGWIRACWLLVRKAGNRQLHMEGLKFGWSRF